MAEKKDKGLESYLNKVADIFNEHKKELDEELTAVDIPATEVPAMGDDASSIYGGYVDESVDEFAAALDEVDIDGSDVAEPVAYDDAYDVAETMVLEPVSYDEIPAVSVDEYYAGTPGPYEFDPTYGIVAEPVADSYGYTEGYDECDAALAEAQALLDGDSVVSYIEKGLVDEEYGTIDADGYDIADTVEVIEEEPLDDPVAYAEPVIPQGYTEADVVDADIAALLDDEDYDTVDFEEEFDMDYADDDLDDDFVIEDSEFDTLIGEEERELDAQLDRLDEIMSGTVVPEQMELFDDYTDSEEYGEVPEECSEVIEDESITVIDEDPYAESVYIDEDTYTEDVYEDEKPYIEPVYEDEAPMAGDYYTDTADAESAYVDETVEVPAAVEALFDASVPYDFAAAPVVTFEEELPVAEAELVDSLEYDENVELIDATTVPGEVFADAVIEGEPFVDEDDFIDEDAVDATDEFADENAFVYTEVFVDEELDDIAQAPTLADEMTLEDSVDTDYAGELEYDEEALTVDVMPRMPEPVALEEEVIFDDDDAFGYDDPVAVADVEYSDEALFEDESTGEFYAEGENFDEVAETFEEEVVFEDEQFPVDDMNATEPIVFEEDTTELFGEPEPAVVEENVPVIFEEAAFEENAAELFAAPESETAMGEEIVEATELLDVSEPIAVAEGLSELFDEPELELVSEVDADMDDELEHDSIVPEEVIKDAEEVLGEDLTALAETLDDDTFDPEIASAHAIMASRTFCDDMHYFPEEENVKVSGFGDADQAYTYAKIPAIYDARGQEICLGDEMAYRNDFYEIGPVIGIGEDCFFTLALTTDTRKKDSYGEREKAQWFLHEKDGSPREFYHYNPDNIERLNALIYNPDYDMDELVSRFRLFASKERRLFEEQNKRFKGEK